MARFEKSHTPRTIAIITIVFFIHVGLWMAYVNNPSAAEWIFGITSAVLATVAAYATGHVGHAKFRPSFYMLAQGFYLPVNICRGTWELFVATRRQIFNRNGADSYLAAVPFEYGGHDSRAAARRMLAITYTTLTPNFIVLGLHQEKKLMIYHQVLRGEVSQLTRNLGARP